MTVQDLEVSLTTPEGNQSAGGRVTFSISRPNVALLKIHLDLFFSFACHQSCQAEYVELANYAPKELDILEKRVRRSLLAKYDQQSFLRSCFDFAELELSV